MSIYRTLKGYNIKSVTSDPANTKEGQIWYNDTLNKIKVNTIKPAAWASGGALNTNKMSLGGCGTQTAGLAFGGNAPPPTTNLTNQTEEYNGSSWAEQNNLNTTRQGLGGTGTQTAGLAFGGRLEPPSSLKNESEEYNGTSWTEGNNLNTARINPGSAGTQTAGLAFGGNNPSPVTAATEEWSSSSNVVKTLTD